MSRDRFRNLERQRPDQPGDADEGADPHTSGRFGKIEPRKPEPAPAPPDPFAPPPEDDSPVEIREDDRLEAKRLHAEHDARTNAHFVEEANALMHERDRRDALAPRAKMDLRTRGYVAGVGMVVIAVLAQVVSPVAWGLAPILLIALLAGMLSD